MKSALLLFLLPGCVFIGDDEYYWRADGVGGGGSGDDGCSSTWYADKDGDGYGDPDESTQACEQPVAAVDNADDCDDLDADVNPETVWYEDLDGDGYGSAGTVTGCEQPSNGALEDGDCDDGDAGVNPGAEEDCGTIADDDCDGETNQVDAIGCVSFFQDSDGDGYGSTEEVCACLDSDTLSVNDRDCDDGAAEVNPAATEICGDGIDNDCDGGPGDCRPSGEVDLSSADAWLQGTVLNDDFGFAVATADFNGDGVDDAIVGGRNTDPDGSASGSVYVIDGSVTGDVEGETRAWFVGEGSGSYSRVGWSVAGVPDMNGDGYDELLVGAPQDSTAGDEAGGAYLLMGPTSGRAPVADAGLFLAGAQAGDRAGYSVAAGEWTGDGVTDVAVGTQKEGTGGTNAGAVYVSKGPNPGSDLSAADATIFGQGGDLLGYSVAWAGDLDGDGIGDLVAGGYGMDSEDSNAGGVLIFHGPLAGTLGEAEADGVRFGQGANAYAGWSVSTAGDTDGDGYCELLVGAPGTTDGGLSGSGVAYLVKGPATGTLSLGSAHARFIGEAADDGAGSAVAGGMDLDGDGFLDFVVGADGADEGGVDAGAAYLLYGPATGARQLSGATLQARGSSDDALLGGSVSMGMGADGPYMLLGAPNEQGVVDAAGAALLIRGGGL